MSTAMLFPKVAKQKFMKVTLSRWYHMRDRLADGYQVQIPFTCDELRAHILSKYMNDEYDGAIQCRYCFKVCSIEDTEFDHAHPLSRGGGVGLENIELPCANCNSAKLDLMPAEFNTLLSFLERELPFARTSVLKRLQAYSGMMASRCKAQRMIRTLHAGRGPKPKRGKPPLIQAIDEKF